MISLPTPLALRKATPDDRPLLREIYGSTRTMELAPLPWSEDQKQAFLDFQFDAQDQHYRNHYPSASFDLILHQDDIAGRLYLDLRADELRIIDIALLPNFRSRGIGTTILELLADVAGSQDLPLTIHVEKENPALRLYHRLGFREKADAGVYLLLENPCHALSS